MADTIVVTDDTTADDLREAITNLAATAHRMPAHWVEKRAAMHERINALLTELEAKA